MNQFNGLNKQEKSKEEVEKERALFRAFSYSQTPTEAKGQKHVEPKPNLSEVDGDITDDDIVDNKEKE